MSKMSSSSSSSSSLFPPAYATGAAAICGTVATSWAPGRASGVVSHAHTDETSRFPGGLRSAKLLPLLWAPGKPTEWCPTHTQARPRGSREAAICEIVAKSPGDRVTGSPGHKVTGSPGHRVIIVLIIRIIITYINIIIVTLGPEAMRRPTSPKVPKNTPN